MTERGAASARVVTFVALAALVAGGLVVYTITHQRPAIPSDQDHLIAVSPEQCLRCHGPGMKQARSRNHPLNDGCFNCHERA